MKLVKGVKYFFNLFLCPCWRPSLAAQASAAAGEDVLVNFSFASKQFASTCFVVILSSNQ